MQAISTQHIVKQRHDETLQSRVQAHASRYSKIKQPAGNNRVCADVHVLDCALYLLRCQGWTRYMDPDRGCPLQSLFLKMGYFEPLRKWVRMQVLNPLNGALRRLCCKSQFHPGQLEAFEVSQPHSLGTQHLVLTGTSLPRHASAIYSGRRCAFLGDCVPLAQKAVVNNFLTLKKNKKKKNNKKQ